MYLLAQMRAASRASELNCSYSLETMCTQRGNSSTLARFRPRSKIRILGSGTPRLNRDLGYGCEGQYGVFTFKAGPSTYLVLAVSVASCGSSSHFDTDPERLHFLRTMMKERRSCRVKLRCFVCGGWKNALKSLWVSCAKTSGRPDCGSLLPNLTNKSNHRC